MAAENIEDLGPDLPDIPAEELLQKYNEVQALLPEIAFPEWAHFVVGSLFGESSAWWHARHKDELRASCVANSFMQPSPIQCVQVIDCLQRAEPC